MKTFSASAGEGRFSVTCELRSTDGNGLACFVYGGELPHVGGHALASPGPKLHGEQLSHCDVWTATVPGHKDAEAAAAVARLVCLATGEAVSCAAGIHVDHASPEQIKILLANSTTAAQAAVDAYRSS